MIRAAFFTPKVTEKTRINIYIGVKKKLTIQQPRTKNDKKSSLKI